MSPTRTMLCGVLLSTLSLGAGCGDDDGPADTSSEVTGNTGSSDGASSSEGASSSQGSDSSGEVTVDGDMIIAEATAFATEMTKINMTPFPSQHGLAATVNVYVSNSQADLFRTLDPANPMDVGLPAGTHIVKEHLDTAGQYDGFLSMYKAPEGYDDAAADWFWARVDVDGNVGNSGKVSFCSVAACHGAVVDSGLVFGVPMDNRL